MNLRKIILGFSLIIFFILLYTMMSTYTILANLAQDMGLGMSELLGGTANALTLWAQFPLALLLSLALVYVTLWDKSLTESFNRLNPENKNKK